MRDRKNERYGVQEALTRIDDEGAKAVDGGYHIVKHLKTKKESPNRPPRYISGNPYLWTSFSDRAFLFPDRATAGRLIMKFSDALAGCEVVPRLVHFDTCQNGTD